MSAITARKSKKKIADSWDDEPSSSSEDEELPSPENQAQTTTTSPPRQRAPSPVYEPPPARRGKHTDHTPEFILDSTKYAGPSAAFMRGGAALHDSQGFRSSSGEEKRPEKTTAAAKRLIAQGIGVRVKTSAEEREYQKAQVENERRRRSEERRRVEESERAKVSVWED